MEPKAKWDFNITFILGATFSFIGLVYFGISLLLLTTPADLEAVAVRSVFLPLGLLFLICGLFMLIRCGAKKRQANRLMTEGRYVWATVTELRQIRSVNGLHGHPCVASAQYTDGHGRVHLFQSRYLYRAPGTSIIGQPVRVYIPNGAYAPYYVDIEPLILRLCKK